MEQEESLLASAMRCDGVMRFCLNLGIEAKWEVKEVSLDDRWLVFQICAIIQEFPLCASGMSLECLHPGRVGENG